MRTIVSIVTGVLAAAALGLVATAEAARTETGVLELRASLPWTSVLSRDLADCPAELPSSTRCYTRHVRGVVRGLGRVSQTYLYPVDQTPAGCPAGNYRVLGYPIRFTVAGKGTVDIAVPGSAQCLTIDQVLTPTYPRFTITGGTGAYNGAAGTGTLTQRADFTRSGATGSDLWHGNLTVPGLEFDLAAPVLSGAASKTVRAPRGAKAARAAYKVTARDAVDGPVPVSCSRKSGSRFPIGRTVVRCTAADTSGNAGGVRFSVTVKAG